MSVEIAELCTQYSANKFYSSVAELLHIPHLSSRKTHLRQIPLRSDLFSRAWKWIWYFKTFLLKIFQAHNDVMKLILDPFIEADSPFREFVPRWQTALSLTGIISNTPYCPLSRFVFISWSGGEESDLDIAKIYDQDLQLDSVRAEISINFPRLGSSCKRNLCSALDTLRLYHVFMKTEECEQEPQLLNDV